ncbi:FN3 associated domain-containing protein [Flavilitoribacter nigricans]|uniref:Peptidylprolyl isomerase n=1 Tax=Flavilitoribacter nigricans (strain ATCC 23147 / DSM 23189 / NBRC 102662 / NCIMB 1420 / SS-2) TaxID=1122177 RepID=A0A2D0NLB2_FLAN2|nr:FN3 associated domain-containing protein [Flavilitoribacter nigricans]PHN08533.1 peptidylprolyl isomerase [Flavilitoribacter nigricans DSM 23189 = NBRC 102662]
MKLFYSVVSNAVFAINLLLIFFLFVEDQVMVPEWLQAVGRMHPMLLHLPIGFLLLLALLPFVKKHLPEPSFYQMHLFVLALGSITAALTALMGFFLARESGYNGELVDQHKWAGIVLSWLTYGLFVWLKGQQKVSRLFQFGLAANILVLLIAGHLGAGITHGEDFVLAPLQNEKPAITAATPVYEALIVPVFQQKCFSCHNESKAKGGLVMTDIKKFRKGGDTGVPFTAGDHAESLLIERLELPLETEEHMPPEGKPQLTEAEIDLLRNWIAQGADMTIPIRDLPDDSPLKLLAMEQIQAAQAELEVAYDFAPASTAVIEELNIPFRTVTPIAQGSPALRAAIFIRETYEKEFLADLLKVRDQLVDLKLDHLPIEDDELEVIRKFHRLEKLNLNNTDLSGKGLEVLADCGELRSLSLSGLPVDTSITATLRGLPRLEELFIWNTALDSVGIRALIHAFPAIDIQSGYQPEAKELLQLSPPVVKRMDNLEGREEIHLKHNFPGAVIRYTVDGSEPDSTDAPIYEGPIAPSQYAVVKARAFRENWLGSEQVTATFFPKSIPIREAKLLTSPNQKYTGSGAPGLIDGKKGFANNFQSPFWIGFRKEAFEALFYPEDPAIPISTITLSYLQNIGSYIMTPMNIEVWGGPDAGNLRLIRKFNPQLPEKYLPNEVRGLDIRIPASTFACYKIVARPLPSLPAWHQGKGDPSWVFLDEVYFYNDASQALIPEGTEGISSLNNTGAASK